MNKGKKSLTDYKRSEIESKRITLKRDNHLLDLSQKQESFRIFLGLNPKDNLKLKSNFFLNDKIKNLNRIYLTSFIHQETSTPLKIEETRSQKNLAESKAKKFFYFPKLSLTASYNLDARTNYRFDLNWSLFDKRQDYSTFQISILEYEKQQNLYGEERNQYFINALNQITEIIKLKKKLFLTKSY